MLAFLDKRNRMKYNILQVISSHKDTPVSLTDLQHATDSSIPTLNKLIDDILNDLTEINEPDVLMEIKDGSQKKFLLKKQNSFILILLLNYYLKNSLKFKLVLDVFYQRFETLEDTADIHFVSVSTLRRELDDLKTILTGFNLTLSGTTKLRVTGKEEHIRLFYTYFFSQGYQAESWPHECFSFQKIQKIEKLFPKSLCPTGDINSQIFLAHSFAVAFTRFKQGFLIDENTLSAPLFMNYLNPEFNREHAILLEAISLLIGPNINPKQVETELKFVYSLLFCHLEYHDKHDIYPDFFMLHPRFIESTFTEKVTRDTFSLLKWLEIHQQKLLSRILFIK